MKLPKNRYSVHDCGKGEHLWWTGEYEVDERWAVRDKLDPDNGWVFTTRKEAREICDRENMKWLGAVIRLANRYNNWVAIGNALRAVWDWNQSDMESERIEPHWLKNRARTIGEALELHKNGGLR